MLQNFRLPIDMEKNIGVLQKKFATYIKINVL